MGGSTISFLLSQAFGFFALICTVISMQLKKKRPLMIMQTASEFFTVIQYIVKNAITGSFMAIVAFFRDMILTKYNHKRAPLFILIIIYIIMTILTIISWNGLISFLPYVGSLIYAFTLWYGKVKWIRVGNALGNSPYLVYTLVTGNYTLFLMTAIEVASAIVGFIRHDILGKKSAKATKKKSTKRK